MSMIQSDFRMPATGEAWRHYKGGLYTIIGMGQDAEGDAVVVYTDYRWGLIQLPAIYVRDLGSFMKQVETGKDRVTSKSVMEPRFRFDREREADEICPFLHPEKSLGYRPVDGE
jgi:hypothetical protein